MMRYLNIRNASSDLLLQSLFGFRQCPQHQRCTKAKENQTQVCQFYIALHDITCMYILYVLFKKAKLRKIYTNIPSELRKPHPEEELCLTRRRRFQPCLSSHQNLPRSAKSPSVWKRVVNSAVPSLAY